MSEDSRQLEKILRSFRREAKRIERTSGYPTKRKKNRLVRFAGITFISLQLLCVALPPFTFPVSGTITSIYSVRKKPDKRGFSLEAHKGIDIAVPSGTAVRSAAPGRVHATGYSETTGNFVHVRHLFGFSTYYGHLQSITTTEGSLSLFRALPIGRAGSTGRSTGSHVHFELRFLGIRLPPQPFFIYHIVRKSIFN